MRKSTLRRISFLLFAVAILTQIFPGFVFAQSSANYTFSTTTSGSLALDLNANTVDMGTGTTQISGASVDQGVNASAISIGFDFFLMGNRYTQFNVTTNGLVSLSNSGTSASSSTYVVSGGTTTTPIISAFAADLGTGTSGKTHYKVVGSSPNRCLVIEFNNMTLTWATAYTNDGTFQVRLYESTGVIEFVYGAMSITTNAEASDATVGIGFATNTTTNNLLYITSSSNTSSVTASFTDNTAYSTGAITNLNSAANGSRRTYVMTPPVPSAPTSLSFTGVGVNAMTLNWTDNASNEVGYAIYRSTDNVTFTYVTTTAANAVSSVQSGLSVGTTYYWRVYAVSEGGFSSVLSGQQATSAPSLSGTITVGTGGTYNNLTLAIAAINSLGLSGPLQIQLIAGYPAAAETYPITFGSLPGISATNTVTMYPTTSGLSITSANTTATIDLNASTYLTIDGRVNQTGAMDLIVANTSTSGVAIRFINEAQNNRVFYCNVQGVNTSTTSGVILFSTTTGTNGNDGNRIDNCNIRDGASTPTNGVYGAGTTTTSSYYNSSDTISNCNIFNFYNSTSATLAGCGVNLSSGNTDWVISGNSFYQTATRSTFGAGATFNGILVSSANNNGVQITGNYIGGTAASCGSTAMTLTAATTLVFRAIQLTVGTTTATSIQNNTIQNIALTTTSTSTAQSGISMVTGKFNCGTTTGNTVGSGTGTGSITFSGSGTGAILTGILAGTGTGDIINIQNNTVGSISVSGTGTTSVRGIGFQGANGSFTVSSNTVGSTSTSNSISNSTNSSILGIFGAASLTSFTHTISSNTVANLTSTGTSTASLVTGILAQGSSGGAYSVTSNTVRNLTSSTISTGTGTSSAVIGVSYTASTTGGATVQQNVIHTLAANPNTPATAVSVVGLAYSGPTSGTNLVARNFVHSITSNSTSTGSTLTGIHIANGLTTYQNNMVRMGINAAGSSITTGYNINGISEALGTNTVIHNSVYVGGTSVVSVNNTFAFNAQQTVNTRTFRNNIFVNDRQNASGTAVNVAAAYAGTYTGGVTATGLTLSHNLYYASTAANTIRNGTTNYTLAAWQPFSGADAGSGVATSVSQISFVDATGGSGTVDLHLTGTTVAEASGTTATTVTDDYDGTARSGLTPVDIGADAGNFTAGTDIFAPVISLSAVSAGVAGTSRTLTGVATITDNVGVSSGASAPRLYYKKKTDNDAFVGNTSADNGWKYVVAANGSSPYDFTVDYTILNGGSVTAGDSIYWFVAAQDAANNLTSNPFGAGNSGNPPVQNVNSKPTQGAPVPWKVYGISASFTGTYTVGTTGATYSTLGAAFTALNAGVITGNIILEIQAVGTTEASTASLNQLTYSGGTFTVTIKPASTATITGSLSGAALIKLNGADNIIIDGSNSGGSDKSLTLTNSNTTASTTVIWLASQGTSSGCTGNTIKNCNINTGGNTTATSYGIFAGGTSIGTAGDDNDNLTIQGNLITKCYAAITVSANATGLNNNLVISSNTIGSNTAGSEVTSKGISMQQATGAAVNNNTIFNLSTTLTIDPCGIEIGTGVVSSTFNANSISDVYSTNTGGYGGRGFTINTGTASSSITVSNNIIWNIKGTGWTSMTSDVIAGILIANSSSTTGGIKLYYNTVNMSSGAFTPYSTSSSIISAALAIAQTGPTNLDIRNNIFATNLVATGNASAKVYAIYSGATSSAYSSINYNVYYGYGTQGYAGFISIDRTTLSNIQSGFGSNTNSYVADPQMQSATNLNPVTSSTSVIPELNSGVTGTGTTTDYNGAARSSTNPDIGAYEFTSSCDLSGVNTATTLPGGVYSGLNWGNGNNATLTFSGDATVDGTLTMGGGIIDMGSNTLTIGSSTSSVGGITRTGGSVKGKIKRWFGTNTTTNSLFPLDYGDGVNYCPASISFTGAPTTGGTLTAQFFTSGAGTLSDNGGLGYIDASAQWPGVNFINLAPQYWRITAADGLAGYTYDITLVANNMNVSVTNYLYTGIVKRANNTQPWGWNQSNHVNTTSPGAQPNLGGTGFTSFSEFGVGGNIDNLLPVELSSFTASVDKRNVLLKWTTASETNNIGFDVERKNTGTENWSKISFAEGHGTSNQPHNYSYEDRNLLTGKYSYRLKQMDNNGNYHYVPLTALIEIGVPSKYDMSQNYPNPFNPATKINYDLPFDSKVTIRVFDMTGREMGLIVNQTQQAGYYTAQFNASNFASGTYFYNIIAEGSNGNKFVNTKKMILVK
ncbi:MAG: hypothetical protein K1X86_04910 [Ignavibacteria bacterium]|nr:hypothetical protein [Ignavibacteria bacterium]